MAYSEHRIVLECNRLSGTVGVSVIAGWSLPGHYRPASPYGRLVFLRKRVWLVNNGWRELKETYSSNWKIPCKAVMFGVSEKRPSSN
ncbi:hypothetical protein T07_5998 [Trichinella nelsoni]|uniref:Uncharacterized protein n=1 Tax=Trichinella nelsoni TaxID=6336 RepID=A0A0V0SHS9_9BILA|nr:hypothetical protein T07_5998 [Trichinella nelsoni]